MSNDITSSDHSLGVDLALDDYYETRKQEIVRGTSHSDNSYTFLGTDLTLSSKNKGGMQDLGRISNEENLAQAILHRLRTIKGEMAELGHAEYGCEIYDLIGEPNNATTRQRIKLAVKEALQQEDRIKEIIRIDVSNRKGKSSLERTDSASMQDYMGIVDIDIFIRPRFGEQIVEVNSHVDLDSGVI